jgi:hypothetical protein
MPQIAPIVINDGATTPVAHTFNPIGKDANGVYWWEQVSPAPANKLGAKRIGYKQTRELDAKKQLTAVSVVQYSIMVPTLETLSNNSAGIVPPPTVAYREVARGSFEISERSLTQERKDTRVLLANLMAHAMVIANLDSLEPSYS